MITVIGDLLVDILVTKEATKFGTDTDGSIEVCAGGQANNVAYWSARDGSETRLIGKVGDDVFGTFLIDTVRKQGTAGGIAVDPHAPTGKIVVLIDSETGERSMIPDRGANLLLSESDITGIEDSDLLYLSGYSLFVDQPRQAVEHAKRIAVSRNIPIALDPSSTHFLEGRKEEFLRFLEGVTFLFPNYDEGVFLTGETEPHKILAALKTYVPYPVLKLGADGCLMFDNELCVQIPAPKVKAIDATGAGDSFTGTFLSTYVRTGDPTRAAEKAIQISSKVVTQIGARPMF
ncbi:MULTISPECIES: carbohydrate kinase family protein [unclassified Paenibacillus]|uniref:carbohydrate kinase family protein n=1 Tax=unclassified Paenibacillus TaxID=185978 RepID=UPI001C11A709|nr:MULTISPECIES: sugar kinase [unclassified Paenibacillus]MBU5444267.1 sugar kinase [Paenibacillus sp. MSJ-34]CAH0120098.1 putative sugar kinase YdjH [Paenibacillus sp. CECT 9249]